MCLPRPRAPLPPNLAENEIKQSFAQTATRIGNLRKAGAKKVGGTEQMRGRGLGGLRLGSYMGQDNSGGTNSGY